MTFRVNAGPIGSHASLELQARAPAASNISRGLALIRRLTHLRSRVDRARRERWSTLQYTPTSAFPQARDLCAGVLDRTSVICAVVVILAVAAVLAVVVIALAVLPLIVIALVVLALAAILAVALVVLTV